jgi:TPR repeat protein
MSQNKAEIASKLLYAAEQGDADAQSDLGYHYSSQKNYAEAIKWYRLS